MTSEELSAPVSDQAPALPDYPRPRVPVLPLLSGLSLGRSGSSRSICLADRYPYRALASGAAAIALALREIGIGAGDTVLIPAYHCRSMVEPALAVGAGVDLYRLHPDLRVDMDDVRRKTNSQTRALLLPHYFGFPQPIDELRGWCDVHGISLIEDCAHAFFGQDGGVVLGARGDYAVTSVRKFFPTVDGGLLMSARGRTLGAHSRTRRWREEIKPSLNLIEDAFAYGRLGGIYFLLAPLLWIKDLLWAAWKRARRAPASVASDAAEPAAASFRYLDANNLDAPMSRISLAIMRWSARARIINQRRERYRQWERALRDVAGAHALHAELPESVVPYMFPLVVDDPDHVFPALKRLGIPIWRWDDLRHTGCTVSDRFATALLQLPCHQELRDREMAWMIRSVRAVLTRQERQRDGTTSGIE